MLPKKCQKKLERKVKKCSLILKKFDGIDISLCDTKILFVGNGGLICGVDSSQLMNVFQKFGPILNIVNPICRPYSFVEFKNLEDAKSALEEINGKQILENQNDYVYLAYVDKVPNAQDEASYSLPPGATLVKDFILEEEEGEVYKSIISDHDKQQQNLKNRLVWHYGYEFNYSSNDVDQEKPLADEIPFKCQLLLKKMLSDKLIKFLPDQLTVNHYLPGQGIPQHIDTHSPFEDEIISLSLGSQVVMEFKHPSGQRCLVLIPRRSLLIMSGESRYLWSHGITSRKNDVVPIFDKEDSHLILMPRETRISLTFRKLRNKECDCDFKEFCDSQKLKAQLNPLEINESKAIKLENKHVSEVYECIADHFSETRYKPWKKISDFLSCQSLGSLLIDAGCGNGKYLGKNQHLIELGCDMSKGLLEICQSRGLEVVTSNILQMPFRSGVADAVLCIAVLHHLATNERREKALSEIIQMLRIGGQALIYVWSLEQDGPNGFSNYVKPSRINRDRSEENVVEVVDGLKLPVHVNRTKFLQQDMLVPWKSHGVIHHRFYHVFKEGELLSLVNVFQHKIEVLDTFYDKGNWCLLFKRIM